MEKEKRGGYITPEQKKELLDFLENHSQLQSGKFSNNFKFKDAENLWTKLANQLNVLPGAQKNWKQWRKTWQDIKGNAKKRNSIIKYHERGTGGGPPPDESFNLNSEEEKVINMIGIVATEGDPTIKVILVFKMKMLWSLISLVKRLILTIITPNH